MRTALLIDGGYLREVTRNARIFMNPDFITDFAELCFNKEHEEIYRIFYYDCPAYEGLQYSPINRTVRKFEPKNEWLKNLARRNFFAVRLGETKWNGWRIKQEELDELSRNNRLLGDKDFRHSVRQKGVDMKIGLDIAVLADKKVVDRLILVTSDKDIIPAMKHGRKEGMQMVLAVLPKEQQERDLGELCEHADYVRAIESWPDNYVEYKTREERGDER